MDEVEVNFLPVGHTHNRLDAWFSKIAQQARHHELSCKSRFGNFRLRHETSLFHGLRAARNGSVSKI